MCECGVCGAGGYAGAWARGACIRACVDAGLRARICVRAIPPRRCAGAGIGARVQVRGYRCAGYTCTAGSAGTHERECASTTLKRGHEEKEEEKEEEGEEEGDEEGEEKEKEEEGEERERETPLGASASQRSRTLTDTPLATPTGPLARK